MSQGIHFFETKFLPNPKSAPVKKSFEPAINQMLASVHQTVKYNTKPSAPKIPKAVADTIVDPKVLFTGMGKEKKRTVERRSFPELKADLQMHNLRAARRGNDPSEMTGHKSQQRFREVLRQKRILQNMLNEHQKLKNDRDSIASEIHYMRAYLDNIRDKLDISLRKLNSQKMSSLDTSKKVVKRASGGQRTSITNTATMGRSRTRSVGQRMSGGVDNSRSPSSPSKLLSCRKSISPRKPSKRWEYCPRIERKSDLQFLS